MLTLIRDENKRWASVCVNHMSTKVDVLAVRMCKYVDNSYHTYRRLQLKKVQLGLLAFPWNTIARSLQKRSLHKMGDTL